MKDISLLQYVVCIVQYIVSWYVRGVFAKILRHSIKKIPYCSFFIVPFGSSICNLFISIDMSITCFCLIVLFCFYFVSYAFLSALYFISSAIFSSKWYVMICYYLSYIFTLICNWLTPEWNGIYIPPPRNTQQPVQYNMYSIINVSSMWNLSRTNYLYL